MEVATASPTFAAIAVRALTDGEFEDTRHEVRQIARRDWRGIQMFSDELSLNDHAVCAVANALGVVCRDTSIEIPEEQFESLCWSYIDSLVLQRKGI